MNNGDRIRTFSNEQLAFMIMCPVESGLAFEGEMIAQEIYPKCKKNETSCTKCCFEWLNQEEYNIDDEGK